MTTKKVAHALIATVALCLCTPALHAEKAEIFVMGGGASLRDAQYFEQNTVPYTSSYAMGGRGMVGAETPLNRLFGLEGAFTYGQSNLVISNFGASPAAKTSYGIKNLRYSGNLVGHSPITFRGWRPYATAGIEIDSFLVSNKAAETAVADGFGGAPTAILRSQDKEGFNFGGGLEWKATSRISLRLDLREHLTGSPNYALPSSSLILTDPIFPIAGKARNVEYSIGIVYFLHK
jgi:opacity protein-like surface antigen